MGSSTVKPRGCFQCTKRRIICDGVHPICGKCQKKGIECSGLGRYRFSPGVAARGRLKGCTIPAAVSPESTSQGRPPASVTVPQKIRWKQDQSTPLRHKAATQAVKRKAKADTSKGNDQQDVLNAKRLGQSTALSAKDSPVSIPRTGINGLDGLSGSSHYGVMHGTSDKSSDIPQVSDDLVAEVVQPQDDRTISLKGPMVPWLAPLSSRDRMYLSHFANEVAPVMVIFDDVSNGYRDILLPLACEDEVLRHAIRVVAAQHLALRQQRFQPLAETGRAALISHLRRDSFQATAENIFSLSSWATLIVLLVGETITGSKEYSHLLQGLLSLAHNLCPRASIPVNQFLLQQTHMFQFLGQPLLGETEGMDALSLHHDHYLDWTHYSLPPESEHNRILHIVRTAFITASQIYILRATTDLDQWDRIERLKQLVYLVGPDEPGSHALVWVCFMAAADSTDPDHRRFFTDRMNQVFIQTGFQNIPAAIQSLSAIWGQRGSGRWTSKLTQLAPTLIM
ncbi:hypothetical protein BBP40_005067 [Aspergillus hancockii]|nr:hypothetical protein BBP40_005067 [Aspergillus hancockii]